MQILQTTKGEIVLDGGKVNWIRYFRASPVWGEARLKDGMVEVCFPLQISPDHHQCMCETCCKSRKDTRILLEVAEILEAPF